MRHMLYIQHRNDQTILILPDIWNNSGGDFFLVPLILGTDVGAVENDFFLEYGWSV